jgi:hypothetical protein
MKILHLLRDGPDRLSSEVVAAQAREHEVTVIDLSTRDVPYERVVDEIFGHQKVISW